MFWGMSSRCIPSWPGGTTKVPGCSPFGKRAAWAKPTAQARNRATNTAFFILVGEYQISLTFHPRQVIRGRINLAQLSYGGGGKEYAPNKRSRRVEIGDGKGPGVI